MDLKNIFALDFKSEGEMKFISNIYEEEIMIAIIFFIFKCIFGKK